MYSILPKSRVTLENKKGRTFYIISLDFICIHEAIVKHYLLETPFSTVSNKNWNAPPTLFVREFALIPTNPELTLVNIQISLSKLVGNVIKKHSLITFSTLINSSLLPFIFQTPRKQPKLKPIIKLNSTVRKQEAN